MFRNYEYRLYPNASQEAGLSSMLGVFCDLYNAGLEQRISAYAKGVKLGYVDQANELKAIRVELPELASFSYSAEQQVLRRLDKAMKSFFRRVSSGDKPGFPRFQAKSRFDSAEFRFGDGLRIDLKTERLRIVGIDSGIKVKWHRELPNKPKTAVVFRRCGKWYICFQLEIPEAEAVERAFNPVGLDMGLKALLIGSDGIEHPIVPFHKQAEAGQRRHQRRIARRAKGSKRRRKAGQDYARHSRRVANRRKDYLHKLSHQLVEGYSHIAIEDLNIKGLAGGMLAKAVHNAAWGQLTEMLTNKAASAGCVVVRVNPNGTSQACSGCGVKVPKDLSVRMHDCPECGLVLCRDVNAARNILTLADFQRPGPGLQAQSTSVGTRLA